MQTARVHRPFFRPQTNERKEAMCFQLRDALAVGHLLLHRDFCSVKLEKKEALDAIRGELCRFAIVTEPPKTLFGKVRRCFASPFFRKRKQPTR